MLSKCLVLMEVIRSWELKALAIILLITYAELSLILPVTKQEACYQSGGFEAFTDIMRTEYDKHDNTNTLDRQLFCMFFFND